MSIADVERNLGAAAAIEQEDLRERGFEKPPATSELLNWIGALERTGTVPDPQVPPLTGILLKRAGDIQRYRGGSTRRPMY